MATSSSQELDPEDLMEECYLNLPSNDDVKVNIAVVGKSRSGRSSFVDAVRRVAEDDENAAKAGEYVKLSLKSFVHPDNTNISFSKLPSIDEDTFPEFQLYFNHVDIEMFDVFLIFTAGMFGERHLLFANEMKHRKKHFIWVRSKIDLADDDGREGGEEMIKEHAMEALRSKLDRNLKKHHIPDRKVYLISNQHPTQFDFDQMMQAITGALPSPQKKSFSKIVEWKRFNDFIAANEKKDKTGEFNLLHGGRLKRACAKIGLAGIQKLMKQRLRQWKEETVNIAVIGDAGVGKSSYINALRGLEDEDPLAAKTGEREETTVPTSFPYPMNEKIRIWDLPGIGTPTLPDISTFCQSVKIEIYDAFLIMCAGRFTNLSLELAKKVQSMEKPFFFLRTKVDEARRARKRKLKSAFNEEEMLNELREYCFENLQDFDFSAEKIFLTSSWYPAKWDFERLKKAILDELPENQKISLTLTLRKCSKEILKDKIQLLKDRIWIVTLASVVSKCTIGIFSLLVDEKLIKKNIEFYRNQMGFPESSSNEFKKLPNALQEKVNKFELSPEQDVAEWLKSFDPENEYSIKSFGPLILTNSPLRFVYWFLNLVLDEMEETAMAICDEEATRKEDDEDSE